MQNQLLQGDTRKILDWTLGENKPNQSQLYGLMVFLSFL